MSNKETVDAAEVESTIPTQQVSDVFKGPLRAQLKRLYASLNEREKTFLEREREFLSAKARRDLALTAMVGEVIGCHEIKNFLIANGDGGPDSFLNNIDLKRFDYTVEQ